jgi:uncharacterized protein (DUF1810 family)
MNKIYQLERFTAAQKNHFAIALKEIKEGRKRSHWMWYIFPQVQGLGFSENSKLYAITVLEEAAAFLQHPILGSRLTNICNALLALKTKNAHAIFGSPDDAKLKSSMTLFALVPNADTVFQQVLDQFFDGAKDDKTLRILGVV